MPPIIRHIGKKFGKLTIISIVGKTTYGMAIVKCRCDCGEIKEIKLGNLQSGNTKSCGCAYYERWGSTKDDPRTPKTPFKSKLSFIRRISGGFQPKALWKCECGNKKIIRIHDVRRGKTKSCGCMNKGNPHIHDKDYTDYVGLSFGKLTIIKTSKERQNDGKMRNMCICKCACGNYISETMANLKRGSRVSCGCLKESYISSKLKEYFHTNYSSISEYKIAKNPKTGRWLRCDIYLPSHKAYIEVNGPQHYHPIEMFTRGKWNDFSYRKGIDKYKRKIYKSLGKYIEIDIRKIRTVDSAIAYIEERIG